MGKRIKQAICIMLAICFSMTVFLGNANQVQAASKYSKSFSKTITLKGGEQCQIMFDVKKKARVTAKVSANKSGKTDRTEVVLTGGERTSVGNVIDRKHKTVSVKDSLGKGRHTLWITNVGTSKIKYKVKVSAKSAVVRYRSKKITHGDVG